MKKITQVSILYMVAALLFAQPVAQGFSLNQIIKESADSIKPYVTVENCIKGAFFGALAAFVGYAIWNLNKGGKNISEIADGDRHPDGWLRPAFEKSTRSEKIPKGTINAINEVIDSIYTNRVAIKWSKHLQEDHLNVLFGCMNLCAQGSTIFTLLSEFQSAFKGYCNNDRNAETYLSNKYNELIDNLNQE